MNSKRTSTSEMNGIEISNSKYVEVKDVTLKQIRVMKTSTDNSINKNVNIHKNSYFVKGYVENQYITINNITVEQAPEELRDWRQLLKYMVQFMNFNEIDEEVIEKIRYQYENYLDRDRYQDLPMSNEEIVGILQNIGIQNDNLEQEDFENSNEEQNMNFNQEVDNHATDNYEQGSNIHKKTKQKKFGRPKVAKSRKFYNYK